MASSIDLPASAYTKPELPLTSHYTPLLTETMIQSRDMVLGSQEALANNRVEDSLTASSPLKIPERPLGSIVSATA